MKTEGKTTWVTLVVCLLLLPLGTPSSATSLNAPGNYEQCILMAAKAAKGPVGDETQRHCREKFPEQRLSAEELPPAALDKLNTDGGFGYGIFSGNIYNGNSNYTVTQVIILVTPLGQEKYIKTAASLAAKEYNIDVTVSPLSRGALAIAIISDGTRDFSWSVIKAHGHKAP